MSSSESEQANTPHGETPEVNAEAQRAVDAIKEQIAAVRARVQDARETLREHAKRQREPRSFKR